MINPVFVAPVSDATKINHVIIIGAGIAGLVAGRKLAEAGLPVLLIEARNRVGGRIHSQWVPGLQEPVELGAEFIHGHPEDLLSLIAEAGLEVYELEGRQYRFRGAGIELASDQDETFALLSKLPLRSNNDLSFQDFLGDRKLPAASLKHLIEYVEGFNAADARLISSQALKVQQEAEDAIEGERIFHLRKGYSALIDYLLDRFQKAGGNLMLDSKVHAIHWTPGVVHVATSTPSLSAALRSENEATASSYYCSHLIIAVPLGVLELGTLLIQPRPEALDAVQGMVMGPVHRISLVFRQRFWGEENTGASEHTPDLSFLVASEGTFRVWWTSSPSSTPILTGWIGGRRTHQVESVDLLDEALEALSDIFRMPVSELTELLQSSHHHDWNKDPLTCGAYSYVRTGGLNASLTLSQPIENTLFFAGEHTDLSGQWGTVHGALRSGVRAAEQILKSTR